MAIEADVVECLPALEKFAYLMTGEDDATFDATSLTLLIAKGRLGRRRLFPSTLAWLLNVLWSEVPQSASFSTVSHLEIGALISLLQVPLPEPAVLVLVDGYKLDLSTTALVVAEPVETISDRLEHARVMFSKLAGYAEIRSPACCP
ncbi:hypothetical protein SAMN05892877_1552 [Rhizobium subbaraonis]|jgi:xanthosine utilization system XapX-like protein|uniref:Uncharacterized protein n=1 Tax=Rhizobium subbaraonis TaxID=908946 RepID=A0A285V2J1_9HYPH|nr:hypothetical protein [Rhizobium subbaraonis]SOC48375.1 hypothetical protein SAMN05892877_1552 [Rhizobium subbaraonis]